MFQLWLCILTMFCKSHRKLQSISCWALITYLTFYCLRNGAVFAPGFILSPDLCRMVWNYHITKVFIEPTNLRIALYSLISWEYFFKCFLTFTVNLSLLLARLTNIQMNSIPVLYVYLLIILPEKFSLIVIVLVALIYSENLTCCYYHIRVYIKIIKCLI